MPDVIEERPESSARKCCRHVGDTLHDALEIQVARDRGGQAVQNCETLCLSPDSRLRLLSPGDVARNFRCTDDATISSHDRRDCQRDVEECAVLAPTYRLIVVDALAPADARKDRYF